MQADPRPAAEIDAGAEGPLPEPGFEFTHYARFLSAFFGRSLGFSILLASLAAIVSVTVAFPFTYMMTRLPRRVQVRWLIFILAVLSLSEVIIGFSWSTLLSRTAGVSNVLVWLGALDQPQAAGKRAQLDRPLRVRRAGDLVCGSMRMPDQVPAEAPSCGSVYFAVPDCEATAQQALSLGGRILTPRWTRARAGSRCWKTPPARPSRS